MTRRTCLEPISVTPHEISVLETRDVLSEFWLVTWKLAKPVEPELHRRQLAPRSAVNGLQ